MVKVSIIVPVYNVENYLEKCLQSLVDQTLKEIEIIVVNDGSKDNSQKIIDRFASKDSRILPLKKENGGLSDARNYAFPYVKGKYVGFVDSDDYVDSDMFETLYQKIEQEQADLVECDYIWEYDDPSRNVIDHSHIIDSPFTDLRVIACNKLFRFDIIRKEKLQFPKGLRYEDISFTYQYLPYAKKIVSVDKPFYHYLQRENSIANTQNPKVREIYDILNGVLSFYQERGFYDTYDQELEYLFLHMILGRSFYRISSLQDKKLRKAYLKEGYHLLNETFPKWKRNVYLKKKKGLRNWYYRHLTKPLYYFSAWVFHHFGEKILDKTANMG